MAVLTTLVRLLELKVEEMEGPNGTGPLEADIALLEDDAAGAKLPSTVQLHLFSACHVGSLPCISQAK